MTINSYLQTSVIGEFDFVERRIRIEAAETTQPIFQNRHVCIQASSAINCCAGLWWCESNCIDNGGLRQSLWQAF